jgi:hypothetical protein
VPTAGACGRIGTVLAQAQHPQGQRPHQAAAQGGGGAGHHHGAAIDQQAVGAKTQRPRQVVVHLHPAMGRCSLLEQAITAPKMQHHGTPLP